MTDEKPLHVRTAEALGWTEIVHFTPAKSSVIAPVWAGTPPEGYEHWKHGITEADFVHFKSGGPPRRTIPRYDTDWSATGPLIEKYALLLNPPGRNLSFWVVGTGTKLGDPREGENQIEGGTVSAGSTPLIAICNLILALKAAGKLELGK